MTTAWWPQQCPQHLVQSHADLGLTVVGPAMDERVRAEVIFASGEPYDAAVLDGLASAQIIARIGIGYDAVDIAAATERGILVTNTPEGPTTSTAEHTIALMMAVTHQLTESAQRLRAGTGNYVSHQSSMELDARTLGLLGFGRIGRSVAVIARALGMRVLVTDPILDVESAAAAGVELVDLDDLFSRSDVLSIHAPATPSTIGMIDSSVFAAMKPGSVLINCARGPIVNTEDLVAALESGHLLGAGLDVTEPEPLDTDHPLLSMDNVIVTPHIASSTVAGRKRMNDMAFEQVAMALGGNVPSHLINPEVLNNPRCVLAQS